ncbi:transporter substrate-binding domain-containing protein [Shewanella maritima]|uniref:Transporter substrate-binding domain-containing protein n=1 Tax=Shewanella maritima TaxID=2520507 RepID=A0A411PMI5_9GAMM|nr:transporter substrate-binding domain-containing protein [Shewanella maritima]QBF84725.1 transporter substrate-binding domain-containing protein [Shewanella maritima]
MNKYIIALVRLSDDHLSTKGKQLIRPFITILISILCLTLSNLVYSQGDDREFTIVMSENTYPFQYIDNGEPKGVLIDLWQEWAKVTQSNVRFVPKQWNKSLEATLSGHDIVHAGMAKTQSRQEQFLFAEPFTSLSTYLFIHKSVSKKSSVSDLIPYQIGIVEGAAHKEHLLKIEPNLSFTYYPSRQALLDAAAQGKILVFAGIEGYQRNMILEQDIAMDYFSSLRLPITSIKLAPAIAKSSPNSQAIIKHINQGFAQLSSDVIRQIERRWLGYHHQDKELIIAMQTGVEPYADLGLDGRPHGLLIDLWQLWSEKTGIEIDFVTGDMDSSISLIKRKLADVHIGYPESQQMNTGLKQAWKVLAIKSRLFSMDKHLSDLNERLNIRLGTFPTSPYINEIKSAFPNAQLRYFGDLAEMIDANRNGEIDGFIASSAMTSHYLLAHKLWPEFKQYQDIEFSTDLFSLTRVDDSGIVERIQTGFNLISAQEVTDIERKWLINPDDRSLQHEQQALQLSKAEREYLSSLGAIKLGYVKNWPPMEFQGRSGEFLGINADIKNHLVRQLNLTIIPVAYDNFNDVIADLKRGEIHMVASVVNTPQRESRLSFSQPYWPSPWAIVTNIAAAPVFSLSQISEQRLAVVEGYFIVDQLHQQYPHINLINVANVEDGIEAVNSGRVDMFLDKAAVLASHLQGEQYTSLKLSLLADLAEQHSQLAVFPGVKQLIPLINRSLATIDDNEQQRIYQKWVTVDVQSDTASYQRWVRVLIVSLLLLSAIAALVLLANRRLNVEIRRRESAESQLIYLANHDAGTKLPNRILLNKRLNQAIADHQAANAKFALLFVDLDGFKAVNDVCGHHVGDLLLAKVGELLVSHVKPGDTVARFGGDEFVILINHVVDNQVAVQIADNILQGLHLMTSIEQHSISISASIGIALYPDDGTNEADLLHKSDQLMYQAKKFGGHQHKLS